MELPSATTSIVAILQLSAKVVGYLTAVRDASKDCTQCATEVSNLHSLLSKLKCLIDEGDVTQPWYNAVQSLAAMDGPLDQFKQALVVLENKMTDEDRLGNKSETLVWKLNEEDYAAIMSRMKRLKSLVEIAIQIDHVQLAQTIKDNLDAISKDANSVLTQGPGAQSGMSKTEQDRNSERYNELLERISSSDYPTQQSDIISHRQKGTGEWFLATPEVKRWLNGPKETLLCLGIPGAGKTMMAAIVIDHLLKKCSNEVVYVFCNHNAKEDQSAFSMLSAILKQLVQAHPSTVGPIKRLYELCVYQDITPSLDVVFNVLQSILTRLPTLYIVIDALDECQDGSRGQFLAKLRDLQVGRDVHVMVTSRSTPDIVDAFGDAIKLEVRASDEDMKRFVSDQIFRLPRCIQHDSTLQEMVREKAVNAADGMFLLARLHVDSLLSMRTSKEVKTALDELPTGSTALNDAYKKTIHRIEGQLVNDVTLAKKVLSWVTFAKRPLTVAEICCALAVQPGDEDHDPENLPYVEDLVVICAGLIIVDPNSTTIRLVHSTAQEYLERTAYIWNPTAQVYITSTCLTYLSFSAFKIHRHSYEECLEAVSRSNEPSFEEFKEVISKSKFLAYAVKHWGDHAVTVEGEVCDLACSFLSRSESVSCATDKVTYPSGGLELRQCYENRHCHTALHLTARFGLSMISESIMPGQKKERVTALGTRNAEGQTPLDLAAEHGHYKLVELLVDSGADTNALRSRYGTALQEASYKGHDQIVQLLLDKGANANDAYGRYGHALAVASSAGHEQVVRILVNSGADVNKYGGKLGNALYRASIAGQKHIMALLVDLGADVNAQGGGEFGNALQAASYSGHEQIVRLLVDLGTDLDVQCGRYDTALQAASYGGHEQIVSLLVDADAHVDAMGGEYGTALQAASYMGYEQIARLLVGKGADVNVQGGEFGNALQAASYNGHEQVVTLLIHSGADINSQGGKYGSALQASSSGGNEHIVRLLLEKGANINAQGGRFGNALQAALVGRRTPIVRLLLDKGADVNAQGGWFGSPLQAASFRGNEQIVKFLLERGADINATGGRHGNAFGAASRCRHERVERLLLRNGAIVDTQNGRYSNALYAPSARGHKKSAKLLRLRE